MNIEGYSLLTGWLPQDDMPAYLLDMTMAHLPRKRKQNRVEDTAAMHTNTAAAPAMDGGSAASHTQQVSTHIMDIIQMLVF